MIEIVYKWKIKNNILTRKVIGLGYHKGNTNYGQSDFLTIISEEIDITTEQCVWATLLFSSGMVFRRLKHIYQKKRAELKMTTKSYNLFV